MLTINVRFEETLWKAADKLMGSMDSSEYKYVVLGLIFLKYISDKFETQYEELIKGGRGSRKIEMNIHIKIYSGYQKRQDGII